MLGFWEGDEDRGKICISALSNVKQCAGHLDKEVDNSAEDSIWHSHLPQRAVVKHLLKNPSQVPPLLCSCNSSNSTQNSLPSIEFIWATHHCISHTSCCNK